MALYFRKEIGGLSLKDEGSLNNQIAKTPPYH